MPSHNSAEKDMNCGSQGLPGMNGLLFAELTQLDDSPGEIAMQTPGGEVAHYLFPALTR
jgi:hypothetical protein